MVPLSNAQSIEIYRGGGTYKSTATRILRSGSFVPFFVDCLLALGSDVGDAVRFGAVVGFLAASLGFCSLGVALDTVGFLRRDTVVQLESSGRHK